MGAPPVVLPTKQSKKKPSLTSQNQQLAAMIKGKGKAWAPYLNNIRTAAAHYNLDPVDLLALLIVENSGADRNAVSSAGAKGWAQIITPPSQSMNPEYWQEFKTATAGLPADPQSANPQWSLEYAAYRLKAGMIATGNNLNRAYVVAYNPGFNGDARGANVSQIAGVPTSYTSPESVLGTPVTKGAASATQSAATKAQEVDLTHQKDPWVVRDPKTGNLKFVKGGSVPPKNVLIYKTGQGEVPLSLSQLQGLKYGTGSSGGYDDIGYAYTGKIPSLKQVAAWVAHGWSQTTLQNTLADSPAFFNSPYYKTNAPAYIEEAKTIYGSNFSVDRNLIRNAIKNQMNDVAWQGLLRALPSYTKSNEFKQNYDTFEQAFQSIYGTPTGDDTKLISNAVLARWTPDQFAQYLRSRPEYVNSIGYQLHALGATQAAANWAGTDARMVSVVGNQPITATNPYAGTAANNAVPTDKRIGGTAGQEPQGTSPTSGMANEPYVAPHPAPIATPPPVTFTPPAPPKNQSQSGKKKVVQKRGI